MPTLSGSKNPAQCGPLSGPGLSSRGAAHSEGRGAGVPSLPLGVGKGTPCCPNNGSCTVQAPRCSLRVLTPHRTAAPQVGVTVPTDDEEIMTRTCPRPRLKWQTPAWSHAPCLPRAGIKEESGPAVRAAKGMTPPSCPDGLGSTPLLPSDCRLSVLAARR